MATDQEESKTYNFISSWRHLLVSRQQYQQKSMFFSHFPTEKYCKVMPANSFRHTVTRNRFPFLSINFVKVTELLIDGC
jgi:hypothetical protein